jgi:predicted permease
MMHAIRARLRLLSRGDAEARMDEELRFHLEMETEKNLRAGMTPAEARRQAVLAFGGVEGHKEEMRDGRTLAWAGGLSLDLKLGFRMLRKYPGLTLVGGLAIAFAICVGAGTFEFVSQVVHPTLPLPDGGRIVGIRHWDAQAAEPARPSPRDFDAWRDGVRTIEDVGAFRGFPRNLSAPGVQMEPVVLAEMSASGFRVARVPPLLGRTLVDEDERPGATPVVVLGHDLWRRRFGGDPRIVGREVRLGAAVHTVVGVMPRDFGFPIAHEIWAPLPRTALASESAEGPGLRVFGRLAPGATMDEAQAELAALGRRAAADLPRTHANLQPQVLPYATSIIDMSSGGEAAGLRAMNLFLVALLVLVCGNVALLMFARAVSREGEIVVRNTLGASRGRIIAQLFVEALVLAGVAAAVGLAATDLGLRWALPGIEAGVTELPGLPFWIGDRISPATVVYAGVLTVLAALVAGVLPALKVTRALGTRLRRASAGGGGYRFGGVWTAVIIAQVAVTVVFPAAAYVAQREAERGQSADVGFATARYLTVRLEADPAQAAADSPGAAARARATAAELERRVEAEPAVVGATFAGHLPRMDHPYRVIELDEGAAAPVDPALGARYASYTSVAPDYFSVVGVPVLRGRGFEAGDLAPGARSVVVNQSFVQRVLGGGNPIGRRVRYVPRARRGEAAPTEPEPWHQIVGVVPDLGMDVDPEGLYHPVAPGDDSPLYMAVHVRGAPESFAPRLRALAAEVDPTLQLHQLVPLDRVGEDRFMELWFWLIVLVSSVALLLSLAGIYAVMAFTVSLRTREIGIRVALGADARRLVVAIFRRPLAQVGFGIAAGTAVVAAMPGIMGMAPLSARGVALVAAYAALMTAVCLLACIVPTRRALRVEPMEALRAE